MAIRDAVNRQSTPDAPRAQCDGRSWAFTSLQYRNVDHPAEKFHPQCPHCGALLGCSRCAGPWSEVVCTKCVSWASLDGFVSHGPFLNTPVMIARRGGKHARALTDYPEAWQRAYRRAVANEPDVPLGVVSELEKRILSDGPTGRSGAPESEA